MRIFATSQANSGATAAELSANLDQEIAVGAAFYEDGLIREAFMDTTREHTYMILEARSVQAAQDAFTRYPHVKAGLISFEFTELIGLPAVSKVHESRGEPLPSWWPTES
jgi:hypothetical protein